MAQKKKTLKVDHSIVAAYLSGLANTALAILTLFICFFGIKQLNEITASSQESVAFEFNKEFYTENNRELIMLIDMDCLKFSREDPKFPVFLVNERAKEYLTVFDSANNEKQTKTRYSSYEIDMLMGLFDRVNHFEENNMLSMDTIDNDFGWKIVTVWEYPAIQEYVSWIKERYNKNLYEGYGKLYNKIKNYEKSKPEKKR
ncbi:MAG: hypothetical protein WCK36_03070 [Candidatus Firestonebacteria bacterium]